MVRLISISFVLCLVQSVLTLAVSDDQSVYERNEMFNYIEDMVKHMVEKEVKMQLSEMQETHKREMDELYSNMNAKYYNLKRQIKQVRLRNSALIVRRQNYERKMEVKIGQLVDRCGLKSAKSPKFIARSRNSSEAYNQHKESLKSEKPKHPADKHVEDPGKRKDKRGNGDDAELLVAGLKSTPIRTGVAFYAKMGKGGLLSNVGDNQHLEFSDVVTQEGNDYNGSTSTFTCSRPGVYFFIITIRDVVNKWFEASIVKNGSPIGSVIAYSQGHGTTHSSTALVRLNVGDNVWVRVNGPYHDSGPVVDEYFTTFTGFMLYQ